MNVGCLIKNIFKGALFTLFVGLVLGFMIAYFIDMAFAGNKPDVDAGILLFCTTILPYPLWVYLFYRNDKKDTTCPRCKTPFSYYVKNEGYETLSSDYISEDVKVNDGNGRHHFERRAFKVGKRKHYYKGT